METGILESSAEVESLRVRMEYISSTAFFQIGNHVRKCSQKELIKLITLHTVILDCETVRAFERYTIRRISDHQVGAFAVHQCCNIIRTSSIAAHKTVSAHSPDITFLYKCCFLQCSREIEVIILYITVAVVSKQICTPTATSGVFYISFTSYTIASVVNPSVSTWLPWPGIFSESCRDIHDHSQRLRRLAATLKWRTSYDM